MKQKPHRAHESETRPDACSAGLPGNLLSVHGLFEKPQYEYVQKHLRILSAFYGVLKLMDGVAPYGLEIQAKALLLRVIRNLYGLWDSRLYEAVRDESGLIINLASREYAKCIEKYLTKGGRFLAVTFCEKVENKLVTKGIYAKIARDDS